MDHKSFKKKIIILISIFLCIAIACEIHALRFLENSKAGITQSLALIIWMLASGCIIVFVLFELVNVNKRMNDQMLILSSVADIYYSMHLIDLSDYGISIIEANDLMDQVVDEGENAADMLTRIVHLTVEDEYVDAALAFTDIMTLKKRLKGKKSISMDVLDKRVGWLRMSFITVEIDKNKEPVKVIIATQIIDEEKKREEELSVKVHKDELTGLFNRRAYENDLLLYPSVPVEPDFVYAAMDINGLKNVNDNIGHAAGDELIRGAAECLKRTLGTYGKIYRTGGDEFVSMFFVDEEHLHTVISDLEKMVNNWTGEFVSSLSLSVGYVAKKEFSEETVIEMAKIADQRMYQAKSKYYSQRGIDRRGQAAAHTALCNLYTKILKINLTEDTFNIVNMDIVEQTIEKGYSKKISEWLHDFGETGQVHPDDIDEYMKKTNIDYLRDYFGQDMNSISIFYRRKYGDEYKQVVMEMIPADDYENSNQSLFLYVKIIDK